MYKISVIIPIYNMEKYLEKCLDSVLNQTLKDIEVIAINDGSKDSSIEILKRYEKKYKNLKVYNNENMGISATRNFGIEKATGEYIAFIDSDDFVDLNMFELMYNKAKNENLDIVVCDYYHYYETTQKKEIMPIISFENTNIKTNPKLIFEINSAPWNKVYKKSLIDKSKYNFPLNTKYEDLGYIPILLGEAKKIGKIDLPLNYYLIRGNSETTTIDNRVYDIFKILDILYEFYSSKTFINLEEVEYLFIKKLTTYNLQQKYSKNLNIGKKFIKDSFKYLDNKFPNWRKNKYFKEEKFLKHLIKSNFLLTNVYINIGGNHEIK